MPRARRQLRPVAAAVAGLALGVVGCGGGDAGATGEQRTDLRDALDFLAVDFALTDEQIECIALDVEESIERDDLDAFVVGLRRVDEGTSAVDDLPSDDEALLTGAIADCVGSS